MSGLPNIDVPIYLSIQLITTPFSPSHSLTSFTSTSLCAFKVSLEKRERRDMRVVVVVAGFVKAVEKAWVVRRGGGEGESWRVERSEGVHPW